MDALVSSWEIFDLSDEDLLGQLQILSALKPPLGNNHLELKQLIQRELKDRNYSVPILTTANHLGMASSQASSRAASSMSTTGYATKLEEPASYNIQPPPPPPPPPLDTELRTERLPSIRSPNSPSMSLSGPVMTSVSSAPTAGRFSIAKPKRTPVVRKKPSTNHVIVPDPVRKPPVPRLSSKNVPKAVPPPAASATAGSSSNNTNNNDMLPEADVPVEVEGDGGDDDTHTDATSTVSTSECGDGDADHPDIGRELEVANDIASRMSALFSSSVPTPRFNITDDRTPREMTSSRSMRPTPVSTPRLAATPRRVVSGGSLGQPALSKVSPRIPDNSKSDNNAMSVVSSSTSIANNSSYNKNPSIPERTASSAPIVSSSGSLVRGGSTTSSFRERLNNARDSAKVHTPPNVGPVTTKDCGLSETPATTTPGASREASSRSSTTTAPPAPSGDVSLVNASEGQARPLSRAKSYAFRNDQLLRLVQETNTTTVSTSQQNGSNNNNNNERNINNNNNNNNITNNTVDDALNAIEESRRSALSELYASMKKTHAPTAAAPTTGAGRVLSASRRPSLNSGEQQRPSSSSRRPSASQPSLRGSVAASQQQQQQSGRRAISNSTAATGSNSSNNPLHPRGAPSSSRKPGGGAKPPKSAPPATSEDTSTDCDDDGTANNGGPNAPAASVQDYSQFFTDFTDLFVPVAASGRGQKSDKYLKERDVLLEVKAMIADWARTAARRAQHTSPNLSDSDDEDVSSRRPIIATAKIDAAKEIDAELGTEVTYRVQRNREEVYELIQQSLGRVYEPGPWRETRDATFNLLWTWSRPKVTQKYYLFCQLVNHIPGSQALTRKDQLKKQIHKYRRLPGKTGENFDITPMSFVLPAEFMALADAMSSPSNVGALWIAKPVGLSRGRGIELVTDITQVNYGSTENVVVQKYIANPFVVMDKKFDLRLYVLVTSFSPLEAFISNLGFVRFATQPYKCDKATISNRNIHLTNTELAKECKDNPHGIHKWELQTLHSHFMSIGVNWPDVWDGIKELVVKSLACVEDEIANSKNCFELFGYDVLLDADLKPWLLEVNASPSMEMNNSLDRSVKPQLIVDTVYLLDPIPFDRLALLQIVERRLEESMTTNPYRTHGGPSLRAKQHALNKDLARILDGRVPRMYGEEPLTMGSYERLAPTPMYTKVNKMKRS
eukprot:PhM_4_TR7563/c0_g1_i1/m.37525/K16602/TTLL5, TTLL10; tubulin polyglutamylase TTLL5